MSKNAITTPSLYIKQEGEQATKLALRLAAVKHHSIVRLTGGCGNMSAADAIGLYDLFVNSFNDFAGGILFGGTRMILKSDFKTIVPGITEIAPLIRKNCPNSVTLGVVPKDKDLKLDSFGLIVSEEKDNDFVTIIHPDQDQCLVLQKNADRGVIWEAEYKECLQITEDLLEMELPNGNFSSLLISYNGGGTTEKEILATAKRGWPVLLINGSGGKSEHYANDREFLVRYPNVVVAEKEVNSVRRKLVEVGVLPRQKLIIVRKAKHA